MPNQQLQQLESDIIRIAGCIRDLTCIIGDNGDQFLKERLTLIHDEMRDIVYR
jgi:hypothetical protein